MSPVVNTLDKIMLGDVEVDRVYLGVSKIYQKGSTPTTTFWFDAENGTPGNQVLTTDTGSGTPWSGISNPQGNLYSLGGFNGNKCLATVAGSLTSTLQWNLPSTSPFARCGFWIKLPSIPAAEARIFDFRSTSSSGTIGGIILMPTGVIRIMIATSGTLTGASPALSPDTWYWISFSWNFGTLKARMKIANADGSLFHDSGDVTVTTAYSSLTTARFVRPVVEDLGVALFDDMQFDEKSSIPLEPWFSSTAATAKPGASNTGHSGVLTLLAGDQIITTNGTIIENREITGVVKVRAANVIIRNCWIRGSSGGLYLVDATHSACVNLLVEYCTVTPDVAFLSIAWNGFMGHGYTARYNDIYNTVDGFVAFALSSDPTEVANVVCEYNWVHDLYCWTPDPGHGDNITHNDGIQIAGGKNITIRGNNFSVNPSVNSHPDVGGMSCVMLTPDLLYGHGENILIEDNWFNYGSAMLNLNQASTPDTVSTVTVQNNKFGRMGTRSAGRDENTTPFLILADPALNCIGMRATTGPDTQGNVFEDTGLPVTVTRA